MASSVLTPWGPSDTLRDRRLPPGPGTPRADVERNHRERLYGAMVAVIDEVGYEGMRVGRVAEQAGVSRSTLYEYFGDRRECFFATFEALVEEAMRTVARAHDGDAPWERRLRAVLEALIEVVLAQPAAARLCLLEAYSAGSVTAPIRAEAAGELERIVAAALAESPERAGMPPALVSAIVGGVRTVIQARLRRGAEHELAALAPDLLRWVTGYHAPRPPLRHVGACAISPHSDATASAPPREGEPRPVPSDHARRLFVALAGTIQEHGYQELSISDLVTAASMSLSTFYDHFESKEAAFLAACDHGVERALAAGLPAYQDERLEWPQRVRAGMRELLSFLAADPEWTYMAAVELLAAGPRARARRDRTIELFTALLEPGHQYAPDIDATAVEAIGGAIYALMYTQICSHGADRLPEILPDAVFLILAPFLGNDQAAAVANGK